MQPTANFNPARLAKSLLRRSRQGALATLMAGSGDPYCSLVNVASHPDGCPDPADLATWPFTPETSSPTPGSR